MLPAGRGLHVGQPHCFKSAAPGKTLLSARFHQRGWHDVSAAIFSGGVEVQSSFSAMGFIWKTHFCTVPALATPADAFGVDEASARAATT